MWIFYFDVGVVDRIEFVYVFNGCSDMTVDAVKVFRFRVFFRFCLVGLLCLGVQRTYSPGKVLCVDWVCCSCLVCIISMMFRFHF